MRRLLLIILFFSAFFFSCVPIAEEENVSYISNLSYTTITNAREFSEIKSSKPFIDTDGYIPFYEILSVTGTNDKSSSELLQYVTIKNALEFPIETKHFEDIDTSNIGVISISENDVFSNGTYDFSIKVSIVKKGKIYYRTFSNILSVNVKPLKIEDLKYCPRRYSFYNGGENSTSIPEIYNGNESVKFYLNENYEELNINEETGEISLKDNYNISSLKSIKPIVKVVNSLSNEEVIISDALEIFLSEEVIVDNSNSYIHYPILKSRNNKKLYNGGEEYDVFNVSGYDAPEDEWFLARALWKNYPSSDRLEAIQSREEGSINENFSLEHAFWNIDFPYETWVVVPVENLKNKRDCLSVSLIFYYKIKLNDYPFTILPNTPVNLELLISNNYENDLNSANWINKTSNLIYDYDNDAEINNQWIKCELDLSEFINEDKISIGLKSISNFGESPQAPINGNLRISDIHIKQHLNYE